MPALEAGEDSAGWSSVARSRVTTACADRDYPSKMLAPRRLRRLPVGFDPRTLIDGHRDDLLCGWTPGGLRSRQSAQDPPARPDLSRCAAIRCMPGRTRRKTRYSPSNRSARGGARSRRPSGRNPGKLAQISANARPPEISRPRFVRTWNRERASQTLKSESTTGPCALPTSTQAIRSAPRRRR